MNRTGFQLIKFYLNKQFFKAKRIKRNEKLLKVRQLLGLDLPEKSLFIFSDGTFIEKEDELNMELNDILDNNNIYLIKNENEYKIINQIVQFENNYNPKLRKIKEDYPEWLSFKVRMEENKKKEKRCASKEKNYSLVPNLIKKELKYIPPPVKYSVSKYYNILKTEYNKNMENNNQINKNFFGRKIPIISSCKKIERINNLDIFLYPKFNFYDFEEKKSISLIVVGESGCGKTTLLNCFVNFLLGVTINDDYRYKVIWEPQNKSQSKSQTEKVNIYNIRSVGGFPPIKIIDTPGFGDTEGIEKDNEIVEQIQKLFKEKLKEINAICFVTKSSNNRLTFYQKYILNRILYLFGEDLKENFIFLLTFCDGGLPNIIEPLKSSDCPFAEIIELSNNNDWYYKFNNSSFFEADKEDEYTKIFWKLGIKNFELFLSKLKSLKKQSLVLTKEVLKERKFIEEKITVLNNELNNGLNKIFELKEIFKEITNIKKNVDESKMYEKITKIPIIKKIDKNHNFYVTTCLICNKTCHSCCEIADDEDKKKCKCMDPNGFCMICPKRCKWEEHKNRNYILQETFEEQLTVFEDLKKRYFYNKNNLLTKKDLLLEKKEELKKIKNNCLEIQKLIVLSLKKLESIALKKFEGSFEDYYDILIEIEKAEHKSGWQIRIRFLEILKEQQILLKQIFNGKNEKINEINEFLNNDLVNIIEKEE